MQRLRTTALTGLIALSAAVAPAAAASAQTTGSVTATITSPITWSGTASTPGLTCTTRSNTYNLRLTRTTVQGYQVTANATIVGYKGPGNYNAKLSLTATGNGQNFAGGGASVPVTITATGGSSTFTKTATGAKAPKAAGKSASGSLAWTCPS